MAKFPHTRSYLRFPFHSPLMLGGESYVSEGVLRNLSMQGCSLVADRELLVGSNVRVGLLLPDQVRALPIDRGRVTWTLGRECGVEFVEVPLHARLRLGRALRAVLIQYLTARNNREWQKPAV